MTYENVFDKSYERVLTQRQNDKDFFEAFYESFLSRSNEVREIFINSNMEVQRRMLKKSFYSLLVFYASNTADDYLNKMVEKHRERDIHIPNHLYDLWLECLIATVRAFDEQCDHEVELAWRLVFSTGITYMKFKH